MRIGILQTGHVADDLIPESGDYPEIFARFLAGHGFEFVTYAVCDGLFPEGPDVAEGWLITGSKHGAYEAHDWIPPLEALIRAIHDSGKPLVGICFGHQIIAQALGGRVEKFGGGWSVGRQDYVLNGNRYSLNAWHQDQVVDAPEAASVVATSDFCQNAGLLYGDRAFTLQPHPEINATYLRGLLDKRAPGVVPDALRDAARNALGQPTDSAALSDMIALFFREKRIS